MAALGPCGPVTCARRVFGTRDEAARGDAIRPAGATLEVVERLQQHEAQECPDAGHRLEQIQGVGVVLLRRFDEVPLEIAEPRVIVPKPRQVHFHALLPGGISAALGDTVAVRLVGQRLPNRGPVVLAVGVLDMGESRGTLAHAVHPAPEEIAGRPHLGGIDVGLREHAPTQEHHDFLGIDFVVFRFAAMDGFHVEGMT